MEPMSQTAVIEETEQTEETEAVDGFGLRDGMTVEVLTMENRLTFVGKVESYRNGAVVLRESKGGELPPVMYNKEIKLRFFRNRHNLVLFGKICGSTGTIWKVDRLESRFTKEQRAYFRQRVSTKVAAQCTKYPGYGSPGGRTVPCQVLDVSAGGMLISSTEEYQVGDRLRVTKICLVEGEDAFSFNCHVRRAGEPEVGVIRYGCQFETLAPKEQDRLLRAIFIVQREEIRRQKAREGL